MFFPEALYLLSDRDLQVTWLDPFLRRATTSVAGTTVDATLTVPSGQVLLLQNAIVTAAPGAGQNITQTSIGLFDSGGTMICQLVVNDTDGAANIIRNDTFTGSVIVPPAFTVRGRSLFNAGVNANISELDVVGMLIPIGNVQRL